MYAIILNFGIGEVDIIKLDPKQFVGQDPDEYLEEQGYNLSNCQWMFTDEYPTINQYKNIKELEL